MSHPVMQPGLRYRRSWMFLGVVMLLTVAVICLAPMAKLPVVNVSDKIEHTLAFGWIAFWFACIVVRRDLVWVGLGVVLFGGLIELAQGYMGLGRQADMKDLAADALGVLAGIALALTPLGRWVRWLETQMARFLP
jgi:VanZ family protein